MIKLKDLINRQYKEKQPLAFDYELDLGKDDQAQPMVMQFHFTRSGTEDKVWMMEVKLPRTAVADSQCYYIGYEMPRSGLPLELICATGLRYFKLQMQQEVQLRTNIDFSIGSVTEGM